MQNLFVIHGQYYKKFKNEKQLKFWKFKFWLETNGKNSIFYFDKNLFPTGKLDESSLNLTIELSIIENYNNFNILCSIPIFKSYKDFHFGFNSNDFLSTINISLIPSEM